MLPLSLPTTRTLWIGLLPLVAAALSFRYTCITPFAALASAAALWLPLRGTLLAVTLVWLANQLVGFVFLSYPHDATTLAWGGMLLLGSYTAMGAAAWASRSVFVLGHSIAARLLRAGLTVLAAYVSLQLLIYAAGLLLGSSSFSWTLQRELLGLNALTFLGLLAIASAVETLRRHHQRGREPRREPRPVESPASAETAPIQQPTPTLASVIVFPTTHRSIPSGIAYKQAPRISP